MSNFIKKGANFSAGTKFTGIYNFGSRSSIPSTMFVISMFYLFRVLIFIKTGHIAILRPSDILTILSQFAEVFNFGSRSSIANIIFMINKLDLR